MKTLKRLNMNAFFYMDKTKQCGKCRHNYVAFNKATDRQTDIKHTTSNTEMTAGVKKTTTIKTHKRFKMKTFLIWTRQNNVHIFGIVMLPLTKLQTDRSETQNIEDRDDC